MTIASMGIIQFSIFNGISDTAPKGLLRSPLTLIITVLEALVISISKSFSNANDMILPADPESTIKGNLICFIEASQ